MTTLRMGGTEKEQLHSIGQGLRTTFANVKSLLPQRQEQDFFPNAFENARQRFDLWAVNLGLYTSGNSSLEYRLRDAPLIYNYAVQALADLQIYLDTILQALHQESKDNKVTLTGFKSHVKLPDTLDQAYKGDLQDSDDDEFESYQDSSLTETALENVNGIIDRLYRLSFKIRNPATRLGFSKARKYQEIDNETGEDLIKIFALFDRQHIEQVFLEFRKEREPEDAQEHYLVERLAKANTRRRQQFKQWKTQRIKIEATSNTAKEFDFLIPSSKTTGMEQNPVPEGMLASGQPAPSMPSTVTRLDPAVATLDDTTSTISTSTYARVSKEADFALAIPRLPKKLSLNKEFECPYCHIMCSGRTRNPQPWNHHVLCDLRPYVCTYEDCKDGDQLYDSFKQWLAHETNNHRLARECREHPEEIFESINSWREHLASHNPDSSNLDNLDLAEADFRSSDEKRVCAICTEEDVTHEHVGIHLQQLALFALPRSTGLEDDLNSEDDASAATADDSEGRREDDSDALVFSNEGRPPAKGVYGVDYNDVGNRLADLFIYELTPSKVQVYDDRFVIYNPKLPRELDIELKLNVLHDSAVTCVRFSSDSLWVAVGINLSALIYEVERGAEIFRFTIDATTEELYVRAVCFDTQVVHLAVGAEDGLIRVFNIENRALMITLAGHEGDIYGIEFIPNSCLLLSGGEDRKIRLWDIQTGAEKLIGMVSDDVTSVASSPDGNSLAAGCYDNTATIWNLAGTQSMRLSGAKQHTDAIYDISFSPDGQTIVTASLDMTLKLWDWKGRLGGVNENSSTTEFSYSGAVRTFTGHTDYVLSAVFTRDGRWVISVSMDGAIQFWNPITGDAALRIDAHLNRVTRVDTSPAGNLFATAGGDKSLKIWRYTSIVPKT
ncbi:MAG: hypothetical protein Q9178_000030 [Gyalolechia marmorata]